MLWSLNVFNVAFLYLLAMIITLSTNYRMYSYQWTRRLLTRSPLLSTNVFVV